MQEWWIGYYSKSGENALLEQHKPGQEPDLEEFARIALEGHIGERDFIKMWILAPDSMHRHIVAFCGARPPSAMFSKGGGVLSDLTRQFPMTNRRAKKSPAGEGGA